MGKNTLQHNLGSSLCVEKKVNIDAELVNLNNAEKQTGSFQVPNAAFSFFSPSSTAVGLILFLFGFFLDYLNQLLNSAFHSGS